MIFLEDYLKDGGKIFISPIQENHIRLKAKFFAKSHIVDSQKGIYYLLEHIEQKIAGNKELLGRVEQKFPYSLSWQKVTPLDRLLNKTTVNLYAVDGVIYADFFQIHVSDHNPLPGIQWCRLRTERKRILELLEENPKNFETMPYPKEMKKLEGLY